MLAWNALGKDAFQKMLIINVPWPANAAAMVALALAAASRVLFALASASRFARAVRAALSASAFALAAAAAAAAAASLSLLASGFGETGMGGEVNVPFWRGRCTRARVCERDNHGGARERERRGSGLENKAEESCLLLSYGARSCKGEGKRGGRGVGRKEWKPYQTL